VPAAAGDVVHHARRPVRARHERVDERRLADAGVPDEDGHPVPEPARDVIQPGDAALRLPVTTAGTSSAA
jgi:hypothetical protein